MLIGPNCVVGICYTLTDDHGEVLDQSPEGQPLSYLHGAAGIIPGLEKELAGKLAGDEFNIHITPTEAYGEYQPEMVRELPRTALPADIDLQPGMQLTGQTHNGPLMLTVTAVEGDQVTVDANHPLAGKTLHFEGTVEFVREATADELNHGHAH